MCESGKATAEVGLVLQLIAALGLAVDVRPGPEPVMVASEVR